MIPHDTEYQFCLDCQSARSEALPEMPSSSSDPSATSRPSGGVRSPGKTARKKAARRMMGKQPAKPAGEPKPAKPDQAARRAARLAARS